MKGEKDTEFVKRIVAAYLNAATDIKNGAKKAKREAEAKVMAGYPSIFGLKP